MKFNFAEDITMTLGELPKEYNKAIHGPYDPAVFYGKKDTPLGQVTKRIIIQKEALPGMGLEPIIARSEVWCLIH